MELKFTEDEIKSFEIEFSQLITIESKFDFWIEKLKIPYFLWSEIEYDKIKKFIIKPNTNDEQVKINEILLSHYIERWDSLSVKKKIFNFELMRDSFLKKYDEIPNHRACIEKEIVNTDRRFAESDGAITDLFDNTKRFYERGFNDYYLKNKKPNLEIGYEINNLISLMNGYVLAQYHSFLNALLNKPVTKDTYTHIQQMLILEYFGIADHVKDNATKRAEIYAPIIRRDEEKTRQLFSTIGSKKTEENMAVIYSYFIKNGFSAIAQKVKEETTKPKKKKL